jgi:putative ABC transport system permease protein
VVVVGRLKPGVTIDQARVQLETVRDRIAQTSRSQYLDTMRLQVRPLRDKLVSQASRTLWVLFGAVGFVLLISCVNVANLLLARASSRIREIAIRGALGAGRARVLRQFLCESLVLAALGCGTGLMVAWWGVRLIPRLAPTAVPRLAESTIDGRVLVFAVLASLATACLFGLAPMLSLREARPIDALREGGRTASSQRSLRARGLLVAVELAFAVVLLTGTGLLAKRFWRMNEHAPGFHPESILIMKVPLSGPGYPNLQARLPFVAEALRRVQAVPGIEAVAVTPSYPIRTGLVARGSTKPVDPTPVPTTLNATTPDYARVMGLRVVSGRWITEGESAPVVVLNESLARREYGDEDPVGKAIRVQAIWDRRTPIDSPIVGVVADVKDAKLDANPEPQLYMLYDQVPIGSGVTVVARVARDPLPMAPTVTKLVADIDKGQAVYDVKTLQTALSESIAPRRFMLILAGVFGATALLLALIGIYGVIAYSVAQRTPEIGVRLALGAHPSEVVRMVVAQGMRLAVAGIVLGLAAAIALTRLMVSLLYEVEPSDPQTLVAVAFVLTAAAFVACSLPALRASLIAPSTALRYE